MSIRQRLSQGLLIGGTLALSWLMMQVVHEFGHVIGASLTGGIVQQVVLHPISISRTDVLPNPRPEIVVWSGPLVGIGFPLVLWRISRWRKSDWDYLLRFFAGFCLIANGAYIGTGIVAPVGDADIMLRTGTADWILGLFGLLTIPAGLWCWNGLGRRFGLGRSADVVNPRHAVAVVSLLVFTVLAELSL